MKAIVAVSRNMGIGRDNEILVRNKEDLMFFSGLTQGHKCLVGYNTSVSLPQLTNREIVVDDRINKLDNTDNYILIGGSKTYRKYAKDVDELYITYHDDEGVGADVFFPIDAYRHLDACEVVGRGKGYEIKRYYKS